MYLTWSELLSFCTVIIGIITVILTATKKK